MTPTALAVLGLTPAAVASFARRTGQLAPAVTAPTVTVSKPRPPRAKLAPVPVAEPDAPKQRLRRSFRPDSVSGRLRAMLQAGNVTTKTASERLGITRDNAAKHLAVLRKQGQAVMVTPPQYGPGRSTAVWGLGVVR